jgi:hypothetical protein
MALEKFEFLMYQTEGVPDSTIIAMGYVVVAKLSMLLFLLWICVANAYGYADTLQLLA